MGKPSGVLVVDDDAEMRALLLEVLEHMGYEVAEAEDGAAAVLALRARPYAVVLPDNSSYRRSRRPWRKPQRIAATVGSSRTRILWSLGDLASWHSGSAVLYSTAGRSGSSSMLRAPAGKC